MEKTAKQNIKNRKDELVKHLKHILENELDDSLQGDYDVRGDILSDFESIIDRIDEYEI